MLPLFAARGYKRQEALDLPHWEFWAFVKAVRQEEARAELRQLQLVTAGSGNVSGDNYRDIVVNMEIRAGLREPEPDIPFTAKLRSALGL